MYHFLFNCYMMKYISHHSNILVCFFDVLLMFDRCPHWLAVHTTLWTTDAADLQDNREPSTPIVKTVRESLLMFPFCQGLHSALYCVSGDCCVIVLIQ